MGLRIMQSFKQFLTESKVVNPLLAINWNWKYHNPFEEYLSSDIDLDKVYENVRNKMGVKFETMSVLTKRDEFKSCHTTIIINSSKTEQQLEELELEFYSVIKEELDVESASSANDTWTPMIIQKGTFPNFRIETKGIIMNYDGVADVSLVGIHKVLSAKSLQFHSTFNISEGGLGLMLIKEAERLTAPWDKKGDIPEWFTIVQMAARKKEDLLDVQEELISKGYKQWAKL